MYVEKNIWDNVIGTLLNLKGKIKDGVKAQQDLVDIGIILSYIHNKLENTLICLLLVILFLKKKRKTFVGDYVVRKCHIGTLQILRPLCLFKNWSLLV